MKNHYFSTMLLVLLASAASAQHAHEGNGRHAVCKARHIPLHRASIPIVHRADRAVIWSDDLSDPSHWIAGTEPGANPDTWTIGTEGPTGEFSSSYGTIESTTAANGFALFDSDLYCGDAQVALLQLAEPVDLSGETGVLLEFEQFFTRFRGDCFVDVSSNGTEWNEIEVNDAIDVNASTPNPDLVTVNLTPYAAGQATVWIRFRYFSTVAEHGPGAGCDYAWMVDDVAFTTLPDHELVMNYGYISTTGLGEEYGRIPAAQLPAAMNVGAEVFNFGGMEQTNVEVSMTVVDGGGDPVPGFAFTTNIGPLASQVDTVISENVTLPLLPNDLYTATFSMTSDQIGLDGDPDDNSRLRNFEVTEHTYSLDNIDNHADGITEILQQVGTASFTDNAEDVKLLTMYYVNAPMTVTGFEIGLGPASRAGGSIVISILDTVDVLSIPSVVDQPVDGIESDPYILTTADISSGVVSIPFPSPIELPVNAYYAVATLSGSGTIDITNDPEVFILDDLTVSQPVLASAMWIPFDPPANQNFYGGNGTAWAIRMSSNPSISVAENEELEGVTMYPNPTKDILRITTEQNEKLFVEVMDLLGKVVMTTSFSGSTVLDMSPYADGVYTVRISNGNKATVQRVTLN